MVPVSLRVVVTVKFAVLEPLGIVTEMGTCATMKLLLLRVTVAPPEGAFPFKVTVPVDDCPPFTLLGDNESVVRAAFVRVRVAVLLTPENVAVTVTVVVDDTPDVVMVNVAVLLPEVTVTLAGVVADELLSDNVTTVPVEGAGPLSVTVPVDELPPTTEVGFSVTELRVGGVMVKVACFVVPL
jgi:hypothetical protein